jgi:small subunit ribosomal protein S16
MSVKIRLARGGTRNKAFYRIVAADERACRDGSFLEKLGTYDPTLPSDHKERVRLNAERIQYWLSKGAQPTERLAIILGNAGLIEKPKRRQAQQKAQPKAKAVERAKEKAEKAAAAATPAE